MFDYNFHEVLTKTIVDIVLQSVKVHYFYLNFQKSTSISVTNSKNIEAKGIRIIISTPVLYLNKILFYHTDWENNLAVEAVIFSYKLWKCFGYHGLIYLKLKPVDFEMLIDRLLIEIES